MSLTPSRARDIGTYTTPSFGNEPSVQWSATPSVVQTHFTLFPRAFALSEWFLCVGQRGHTGPSSKALSAMVSERSARSSQRWDPDTDARTSPRSHTWQTFPYTTTTTSPRRRTTQRRTCPRDRPADVTKKRLHELLKERTFRLLLLHLLSVTVRHMPIVAPIVERPLAGAGFRAQPGIVRSCARDS